MTDSEKVAGLKGLAEGWEIDKKCKEGKLFAASIDTLEELAGDIAELESNAWDLGEAIDQVSDDLEDLEDYVYDDDDDEDDEDEDWDDDDGECCCCGDEPVFYEVTCPACGNTITIDEDVLDLGAIECPNCGETLEFDGIATDDEEQPEEDKDGE